MEPLIAKCLELRLIGDAEYRLLWLGIAIPDSPNWDAHKYTWDRQVDFAKQLLHGPWHRVVRRREEARRRLEWERDQYVAGVFGVSLDVLCARMLRR